MERTESKVMSLIKDLREEMKQFATSADTSIALRQALDRLVMGVQNGTFQESDVEKAIAEIRSQMAAPAVSPLMPQNSSQRNAVIARNSRALAERMLSSERGTWDMRHVEIVQNAISMLAQAGSEDATRVASDLQDRMSDSVWAGNLELAETAAQVTEESKKLENDLLAIMEKQDAAFASHTLQIPEADREIAREPEKKESPREAINYRALAMRDAEALRQSRNYAETLARKVAENRQSKDVQHALNEVRKASQLLLQKEAEKLGNVLKGALRNGASAISPEQVTNLSALVEQIVDVPENVTPEIMHQNMDAMRSAVRSVPQMQSILPEVSRIAWRTDALANLSSEEVAADASEEREAQLLEARLMFEQKKMQFEQNPAYRDIDMPKVEEFEMPQPSMDRARVAFENIQRVHQIAQSAAQGDVGLYAPVAGSEHAKNAEKALQIADKAAPAVTPIPTMKSAAAKRVNRLLHDIRQLAFMPSVRNDMGFAAPKEKMDWADGSPLFKRVRYTNNNQDTRDMISAMYRLADVKLQEDTKPLRKSIFGSKLFAANLEIAKMISRQFGGNVSEEISKAESASNEIDKTARSNHERGLFRTIAGYVKDKARADSKAKKKQEQDNVEALESDLRSSATSLPDRILKKLKPFFPHVDLNAIRIVRTNLELLGAVGATVAKTVFLSKDVDFDSRDGIGVLAHEIEHTTHFDKGDSVDAKEQDAERMEERVRRSELPLAVERDFSTTDPAIKSKEAPVEEDAPKGETKDFETIYEEVTTRVMQMIQESVKKERDRRGN